MPRQDPLDEARRRWGAAAVFPGGRMRSGPSLVDASVAAREVMQRLVDDRGRVKSRSLTHTHEALVREMRFVLVESTRGGVRPPGVQLFYLRDNCLVRIKTTGTAIRPRPHMTISLTLGGTGWKDERAKMSVTGGFAPAAMTSHAHPNPPALHMIARDLAADDQDRWANSCHFDCCDGYDTSIAPLLQPAR